MSIDYTFHNTIVVIKKSHLLLLDKYCNITETSENVATFPFHYNKHLQLIKKKLYHIYTIVLLTTVLCFRPE